MSTKTLSLYALGAAAVANALITPKVMIVDFVCFHTKFG